MLDDATKTRIARELDDAERTGSQLPHLTSRHPGITIDDAYAIQSKWVDLKLSAGRKRKGHKIGLTSKVMQAAVNISEPDHGVLLDDMFFADGSDIPMSRFIEPGVEVELAFVLNKPLSGPDLTLFDVLKATDYVTPAIEIIDARIMRLHPSTGVTRKVQDTISDNAANAGVVMGGRPIRPLDVDLRWVACLLHKNGVIEESGVAAAVLNHPANGVAWLARKLSQFGVGLTEGDVVLSGSFTRPLFVTEGDTVYADYSSLGGISCRFV